MWRPSACQLRLAKPVTSAATCSAPASTSFEGQRHAAGAPKAGPCQPHPAGRPKLPGRLSVPWAWRLCVIGPSAATGRSLAATASTARRVARPRWGSGEAQGRGTQSWSAGSTCNPLTQKAVILSAGTQTLRCAKGEARTSCGPGTGRARTPGNPRSGRRWHILKASAPTRPQPALKYRPITRLRSCQELLQGITILRPDRVCKADATSSPLESLCTFLCLCFALLIKARGCSLLQAGACMPLPDSACGSRTRPAAARLRRCASLRR